MMDAPYFYGPMSAGDWWFGSIMMLAWFLFLIFIIVFAARTFRYDGGHWHSHSHDPLDTVKDRYAKGEITKEQYERLRKDLK